MFLFQPNVTPVYSISCSRGEVNKKAVLVFEWNSNELIIFDWGQLVCHFGKSVIFFLAMGAMRRYTSLLYMFNTSVA